MIELRRYTFGGALAVFIITPSADSAMMYGITLVTTARFTSLPNCLLRLGEIVESASPLWTTPSTSMPTMGAPLTFTFEKSFGNMRSSAAALPVDAMVNCQPSREPRQASTASPMTMRPTVGLNMWAYARPNGPMIESRPTGRITPQTVIEPMRPVTEGPPKFATVVSQSSAITPRQVAIGAEESQGMNAER